jgi:hypothetical protein
MKKLVLFIAAFAVLAGALDASEFKWARAKFKVSGVREDTWNDESSADIILLKAMQKYTTIKLKAALNIVELTNLDEMCKYPFIFMHAQTPIVLSDAEVANIREYLERGGFIFVDDCVLSEAQPDLFFVSVKNEFETRIYPDNKLKKLPNDHPIFSCFYELPNGVPTMQGRNHGGWALIDGKGRMKVFMVSTDINCGWNPDYFAPAKHNEALKMGINVVIYALTH